MKLRFLRRMLPPLALLSTLLAHPLAALADGQLTGYVFDSRGNRALPDVSLTLVGSDLTIITDALGGFDIRLPQGVHTLRIVTPGGTSALIEDIIVMEGETTEILLTLDPSLPVEVQIESPSLDKASQVTGSGSGPRGTLNGTVVAAEDKSPVAGARVYVRGRHEEARSDSQGRFSLQLPVGRHDLSVLHPNHNSQAVRDIEIAEKKPVEVRIELSPKSFEMDVFTISAPRVTGGTSFSLEERQQSGTVTDILGAEQMSKAGDSTAASALRRVTGLTIVDGKYVYVRGMGERYSSTLLNGAALPSPEPERRVVPIDLFPVALLDSVVIQKTFTPDMPGEFGGGSIQIRLREVPKEFVASFSVSTGYSPGTTFEKGAVYKGGGKDWLGQDDGTRALSGNVARATAEQPLCERDRFNPQCYSPEEIEALGESMKNVWNTHDYRLPADLSLGGTLGGRLSLWNNPVGLLGALTYSNKWSLDESELNTYTSGLEGELERFNSYKFKTTANDVKLGGIFNVGAEIAKDHRLNGLFLLTRSATDEAKLYGGFNSDLGADIKVTRLRWVERELRVRQFSGEHQLAWLANMKLGWRYTLADALRDEPANRDYRYDLDPNSDTYYLSDRAGWFYSTLDDRSRELGLDLTLPFKQWNGLDSSVRVGLMKNRKDREVGTRRFKFFDRGPLSRDPAILQLTPEEIYTPENIGPDGFQLLEFTRETDNYSARQDIDGYYLMTDLLLWKGWRLTGGVRQERNLSRVRTFQLFNPEAVPVDATLDNTDLLPAATLTWEIRNNMQVRGSYAKTLSLPDFRELSPATYNEVIGGREIYGNPGLKQATIQNFDLRWEWYPGKGETLSIGLFYKKFIDPIESVSIPGATPSQSYANAKGANNQGIELDFRKKLGFLNRALSDVYIASNWAMIQSEVELDRSTATNQTRLKRPLQGQSSYVLNVQAGYENPDWGTAASLLYNRIGRRISDVGTQNIPDTYEEPSDLLDFVFDQSIGDGFKMKAKASNLLDPEFKATQGGEVKELVRKGREYSLGLSWSF